jgi:hypothetical protein
MVLDDAGDGSETRILVASYESTIQGVRFKPTVGMYVRRGAVVDGVPYVTNVTSPGADAFLPPLFPCNTFAVRGSALDEESPDVADLKRLAETMSGCAIIGIAGETQSLMVLVKVSGSTVDDTNVVRSVLVVYAPADLQAAAADYPAGYDNVTAVEINTILGQLDNAAGIYSKGDGRSVKDTLEPEVLGNANSIMSVGSPDPLLRLAAAGAPSLNDKTGAVLTTTVGLQVNDGDLLVLTGEQVGDEFGTNVAACDFTGDGILDLVVAAPGAEGGAGLVYVYAGNSTKLWSSEPSFTLGPPPATFRLGNTLACADLNGDGTDDVIASTAANAATSIQSRIHVYEASPSTNDVLYPTWAATENAEALVATTTNASSPFADFYALLRSKKNETSIQRFVGSPDLPSTVSAAYLNVTVEARVPGAPLDVATVAGRCCPHLVLGAPRHSAGTVTVYSLSRPVDEGQSTTTTLSPPFLTPAPPTPPPSDATAAPGTLGVIGEPGGDTSGSLTSPLTLTLIVLGTLLALATAAALLALRLRRRRSQRQVAPTVKRAPSRPHLRSGHSSSAVRRSRAGTASPSASPAHPVDPLSPSSPSPSRSPNSYSEFVPLPPPLYGETSLYANTPSF